MVSHALRLIAVAMVTLAGFACSNGSNDNRVQAAAEAEEEVTTVDVEVLHASQDAPPVNVAVGSLAPITDLDYGQAANVTASAGDLTLQVDGILPTSTTTVIGPTDVQVQDGERLTVIAANAVAAIEPIVLIDDQPAVDAAEVRVRVVHAASAAPMVDVYVTDAVTDIATVAPLGTFSFTETLGPVVVAAGEYRIRVTPAGDPMTVAYDSGAIDLAGGSDLVVAAITNVATGASPIELAVLTGEDSLRLVDANATADVRVIHASADAPNVDVIANDDFAAPAVTNLAFPEVTGQLMLAPGSLNVKVVPTGAATPVVIDADLDLQAATAYTVMAIDTLDNIQPLVLVDDPRAIATEARLRVIHASALAGEVDLYVVAPGTAIADVEPNFTAVPLGGETGYVSLDAGDYEVAVTPTGTKDVAIGPALVSLEAGKIYSAAARDEVGAMLPLGLILFDDFQ